MYHKLRQQRKEIRLVWFKLDIEMRHNEEVDLLTKHSILNGCPTNYKFCLQECIGHLKKDQRIKC